MSKYIFLTTYSFWKKWLTLTLLLLFIICSIISYHLISSKSEENLSIFYPRVLVPYLFGCFFVIFIVAYTFKKTATELAVFILLSSRLKFFLAKLVIILISLTLFQILAFFLNLILSAVMEKAETLKALRYAISIFIGGMIVMLSFTSLIIFAVMFFSKMGYGISTVVLSFTLLSFSFIAASFSEPNEKNSLKEARLAGDKTKYWFSNEQSNRTSYAGFAPIDIYRQWNDIYYLVDDSLMPQKGAYAPLKKKVLTTEVINTLTAKKITIIDLFNNQKTISFFEQADFSGQYTYSHKPNDEILKIIGNNSTIKDIQYKKFIKDLYESDSFSLVQKLVLVRKFGERGIFTNVTNSLASYDFQTAINSLSAYGINYDINSGKVSINPSNSLISLEESSFDYADFEMFYTMTQKDRLVTKVKSINLNAENNLKGLFDVDKPVSGLYHFEPWIKKEILFVIWTLIPSSLLTIAGIIFIRRELRF